MKSNSAVPILCLLSLALTACNSQLTVKGQFPSPLSSPMPLHAAAHYSPELLAHNYTESSDDRDKWEIQTGSAQQAFFDTLLPALFQQWAGQSPDPESESFQLPGVDIVIKPNLSDFQYSLPRESRSKIFEVWMKYNMQLYQGDGQLLADWFVTAYGKTPSGFMQSDEDAMNEAIVVALRDLGANLTLNFARVPELRDWMERRNNPSAEFTPRTPEETTLKKEAAHELPEPKEKELKKEEAKHENS